MRELTSHKVLWMSEALRIDVLDEPGQDNACHRYMISDDTGEVSTIIAFQNGTIQEAGVNGISNEALLAIVEDRLSAHGADGCVCCNEAALKYVRMALEWLKARHADYVEGVDQK